MGYSAAVGGTGRARSTERRPDVFGHRDFGHCGVAPASAEEPAAATAGLAYHGACLCAVAAGSLRPGSSSELRAIKRMLVSAGLQYLAGAASGTWAAADVPPVQAVSDGLLGWLARHPSRNEIAGVPAAATGPVDWPALRAARAPVFVGVRRLVAADSGSPPVAAGLARLTGGVQAELLGRLGSLPREEEAVEEWAVVLGLWSTVLRPLCDALAELGVLPPLGLPDAGPGPDRAGAGESEERLEALAVAATAVSGRYGVPAEVGEAAAGLHDLALGDASRGGIAGLAGGPAASLPAIRLVADGPYVTTGGPGVVDHLGRDIRTRPAMAFCRCGQSGRMPFCDGTHALIDFTTAKDPARAPDRRDSYVGTVVTVLDNRGICAHSGFCTDRLAGVFHAGAEPFVTPSGGRADDILRAVRAWPSGALSYSLQGPEAREQVDQDRPAQIEISKDGPYRVTGGVALYNSDGTDVVRNTGSSSEHYSLCRCGRSRNKPFCSGMHHYVGFADPKPDPARTPTRFEWAGGLPALLRMTTIFYGKYVPEDPLLAPMFAAMNPDHPRRVACWLGEVFGGPGFYSSRYGGYQRMLSRHLGKGLTEQQRSRWTALMVRSAEDAGLPQDAEFRAAFVAYLEWGSHLAVENSQPGSAPPASMPMPRWRWVCDATPDARVPAMRADAAVEPDAAPPLPGPNQPVGFDAHIKPLFRRRDRQSMSFAFDLWSYDDVTAHGAAILDRLRAGTMPCDRAWPAEHIEVFARWLSTGRSR